MRYTIKAIYPDKAYRSDAILAAMDKAQDEVIKQAKKRLEKTTATWKHSVAFKTRVYRFSKRGKRVGFYLGTPDKVWNWVDEGTGMAAGHRPDRYPIRPKRAKALVFPGQFTPKTRSGKFSSGPGFKGGPPQVRQLVLHPGIKPRDWTGATLKILNKSYYKSVRDAMKKVIRQSGYAYT